MKKAQKGAKIVKKTTVSATPKQVKNQKDASEMKNMRPVITSKKTMGPSVAPTMGGAKNGKKIKPYKSGGKMSGCKNGC